MGALWWLAERVATDSRGLATAGPGGGRIRVVVTEAPGGGPVIV